MSTPSAPSIVSICRSLPNVDDSSSGVFVFRRLEAMSRLAPVHALQPVPYFPILRSPPAWSKVPDRRAGNLEIHHEPMFYIPGVFKSADGYWLYRSAMHGLTRLARDTGIDVIDAHFGYPEGVGALMAARRLGLPVFVTLRGFEAEYLEKPLIRGQIRRVLEGVDGVICVSHFLKDLATEHGADPRKVRVIHNAIDRHAFFPGDRSQARREIGLNDDVPLVLSVGHLVVRKRHHVLIRAFAKVRETRPDARLLIAGAKSFETAYPGKLGQLVEELGLQESVRFLGNVGADEISTYYRAADVFALGTQREGCCNAVLEALACGLPVVTTPVGDNVHFVKDGENGYIVPVDDHDALAMAISRSLGRQDWDRAEISRALGVGDWSDVAGKVIGFFRESVSRNTLAGAA